MTTQLNLPKAQLGKNGPTVDRIGFGLMGLSGFYGEVPDDEKRLELLDQAYEMGARFWDTAALYQDSEKLVGKWFAKNPEKRKDIFLATKFGFTGSKMIINSTPEGVKTESENSFKDLQTDYIDLYYCHRFDDKTPVEKTVEAMAELVKAKKVKYLGLSECSSETLRRAYAVHPITAVQIEYSPFSLDIEDPKIALLTTCRALGVAVVAYSPLGRGLLTGQIKSADDLEEGDYRKSLPRYSKENFPKNLNIVDEIEKLAKQKDCTASQLSIAWLMAQGDDIFPIPGTKKLKYLKENMGAAKVKLTDAEVKEVRDVLNENQISGERYDEGGMQATFRDTPALK